MPQQFTLLMKRVRQPGGICRLLYSSRGLVVAVYVPSYGAWPSSSVSSILCHSSVKLVDAWSTALLLT